jgi:hypothetical protein
MGQDNQQDERIARFLDGEDVLLNADERAVAEDIRRQESAVGLLLPVALPSAAAQRAQRQLRATLGSRRRLRLWTAAGVAAAGVAAAILLALSLTWNSGPSAGGPSTLTAGVQVPQDVLKQSLASESDFDLEADLLAEELNQVEVETVTDSALSARESELLDLQENIREFWIDDTWSFPDNGKTSG